MDGFIAEARALGYVDMQDIRAYVTRRQDEEREERQLQREEKERERQREREREEERARVREHEKAMLELQAQIAHRERENGGGTNRTNFPTTPRIKIPKYQVGERIEPFIARFEDLASACEFDENSKAIQFLSLFDGSALGVLHRIRGDSRTYEAMKQALLKAYGLSIEDTRKQFHNARIEANETAVQFLDRLLGHLDEWIAKDGTPDTKEGLRDLIIRSQLVRSFPNDLVALVKIDHCHTAKEMAEKADAYFEAHGYHNRKSQPPWQKNHSNKASGSRSQNKSQENYQQQIVTKPPEKFPSKPNQAVARAGQTPRSQNAQKHRPGNYSTYRQPSAPPPSHIPGNRPYHSPATPSHSFSQQKGNVATQSINPTFTTPPPNLNTYQAAMDEQHIAMPPSTGTPLPHAKQQAAVSVSQTHI